MDFLSTCKGTKITISSSIKNTDLVKYNEALYFSTFGYDIYKYNDPFFTDVCAPASIYGNDIILEDRKKDFSTSNVSLCNDSCYYIKVDFINKNFICECETVYNFSEKYDKNNVDNETINYLDYYFSLINYKIISCYRLLSILQKYLYNLGFYISSGIFIFSLCNMIIFLKWGILNLRRIIFQNIPNKRLKLILQKKKSKSK